MSNPKCKLNDLCFIIKSKIQSNIGKIVTCKEYLGFFEKGNYLVNGGWHIAFESNHYWLVTGNVTTWSGIDDGCGFASESQLLPIKGEPLEDFEISCKELETI